MKVDKYTYIIYNLDDYWLISCNLLPYYFTLSPGHYITSYPCLLFVVVSSGKSTLKKEMGIIIISKRALKSTNN